MTVLTKSKQLPHRKNFAVFNFRKDVQRKPQLIHLNTNKNKQTENVFKNTEYKCHGKDKRSYEVVLLPFLTIQTVYTPNCQVPQL